MKALRKRVVPEGTDVAGKNDVAGKKEEESPRFREAFRKALKQYGNRSQAERIAWGVIRGAEPTLLSPKARKKRAS